MAKKKKKPIKKKPVSKKKVTPEVASEPSNFWPYAAAIILMVAALFLILGGFGTGGPLPKTMFHGVYWTLGWAAWLAPIALISFGILKFKEEDKKVPLNRLVGMTAFLVFSSAWFFVTFATKDLATNAYNGGHGGEVGSAVGKSIFNVLDKIPGSILLFVLAILMFFFAFGISPKVITSIPKLFKKKPSEDTDLADLKAKSVDPAFKLNEGVPVEHHGAAAGARMATFKNSAEKYVGGDKEALTTNSDPDWKFPSVDLLIQKQDKADAGDINKNAEAIKETFTNFNIPVEMEGANIGPRVTQYTLNHPQE